MTCTISFHNTIFILAIILLAFSSTLASEKVENSEADSKHKVKAGCYDKWNHFRDDLESSTGRQTFVICPGATLNPGEYQQDGETFSHAEIDGPDIFILCGESGSYSNKCTISGGLSHFSIGANAGAGILMSGIRFEKATDTSINAFGPKNSHLTIRDCVFEENTSTDVGADNKSAGAIFIVNDFYVKADAMNVVLEGCSFVNNQGDDAIILNRGGYLTVKNTYFSGIQDGWSIVVGQDGSLLLETTCFYDNYGPVYLYTGSYLINNSNVYGSNTLNDPEYECQGVVIQGITEHNCSPFEAQECKANPLTTVSGDGGSSDDTATIVTVSLVVLALGIGVGFFLKRKGAFGRHKKYDFDEETDAINRVEESDQSGSLHFTEENDDGDVVRPIYV